MRMPDLKPGPASASRQPGHSRGFQRGVVLMVASVPFGYGGAALATLIGAGTGHPARAVAWGVGIYILSWGMLGLGFLLAGPAGLAYLKERRRRWRGRRLVDDE
jgi:hypothetical protein